jgi:hypothetical protein
MRYLDSARKAQSWDTEKTQRVSRSVRASMPDRCRNEKAIRYLAKRNGRQTERQCDLEAASNEGNN